MHKHVFTYLLNLPINIIGYNHVTTPNFNKTPINTRH